MDTSWNRPVASALGGTHQEEQRFFQHAAIPMHWVGPDGAVIWANQAELDLLGYTAEEFIGRRVAEFHADRRAIDDVLARLKRGETLHKYPAQMLCRDGSMRDVLIDSSGLWENGEFVHGRCFTVDVTDLKRAEESQALLAAIVSASDDAIVSKSLDGIIQSWNAGAERLFGYRAAEALGKSIGLIIPPELWQEEQSILEQLKRGQRIEHFETVRVSKGGQRIAISLTVSPIWSKTGQIIGASKVARDITDRKLADEALRRSEERFRELVNNIDQIIWTCDELGLATWYNNRWYEYTGAKSEDMQGDGWKSVHHPAHLDRVASRLAESARTGQPWEDTFPLRRKDGKYRWFLSRAIPIRDEAGKVVRWLGTNTDVTKQREMEESLMESDRRKDEFLAVLGHELRNPLAPLLSGLELLGLDTTGPDTVTSIHAMMHRQLTHLTRLVDDLLDASRISRGIVQLQRTTFDLHEVIDAAVELTTPLITKRSHRLVVRSAQGPLPITGDLARLTQVVANLLNNAANYTPPGGTIEVHAEAGENEATVRVIDTGFGIPPERLATLFEMFAQVPEHRARTGGLGLGIGLALARQLIELHGGSVEAKSEGLECGSEFVVRLPLSAPQCGLREPLPTCGSGASQP